MNISLPSTWRARLDRQLTGVGLELRAFCDRLGASNRGVVSDAPMADTWITDLTHFLEGGRLPRELPGQVLRLVEYLGRIVAAVTGVEPDDPLGVRCRRRPGRRPCSGEIEGYIVPESNDIHWECLACGDRGLISNWENTIWDFREAGEYPLH